MNSKSISINKELKNTSAYNLRKRCSLLLTSLINYSDNALRVLAVLGIFISIIFFLICIFFFFSWFLIEDSVSGWSSLIVSIWFFGALNLSVISILALFIASMIVEVKRDPPIIVEKEFQ